MEKYLRNVKPSIEFQRENVKIPAQERRDDEISREHRYEPFDKGIRQ